MKVSPNWYYKSGVYHITNMVNGKRYVGSSKNLYQRLSSHRAYLRKGVHQNSYLQNSWNKHGEEAFDCGILEFCEETDLITIEQKHIDIQADYNITLDVIRSIRPEEANLKQSITRKARMASGQIVPNGRKIVSCYTLEGVYINTFESITKAAEAMKIGHSSLERTLLGLQNRVGKYMWRHGDSKLSIPPYKKREYNPSYFFKPVSLTILETGEVIIFPSIKHVAQHFKVTNNTISYVINRSKSKIYKNKYLIEKQDLIKSRELLETPEEDNQQPSTLGIE